MFEEDCSGSFDRQVHQLWIRFLNARSGYTTGKHGDGGIRRICLPTLVFHSIRPLYYTLLSSTSTHQMLHISAFVNILWTEFDLYPLRPLMQPISVPSSELVNDSNVQFLDQDDDDDRSGHGTLPHPTLRLRYCLCRQRIRFVNVDG